MKTLITFLILSFPVALSADMLSFRDGRFVNGTWIDLDANHITFMVDNQLQTYPRVEVSEIRFGTPSAAQTAFAPLPEPKMDAPAPVSTAKQKTPKEPDVIGAVFYQDETGELLPLERKKIFGQQIDGSSSTVRLRHLPKMLFVVRLANGIDPASWDIYPLEARPDGRRLRTHPQSKLETLTILTNVTKFGESSYGLSAAEDLPPGEYAFSSRSLKDGYCFGIDPQ